ncbi:MAG: heme exporter protein CcmB [Candidatus Zixiibacteriota bacterium]
MSSWVRRVLALTAKDIRCELRTRYALNALAMFAVITLIVVGLTIGQEVVSSSLHASFIWIIILFSSMQALAASFIKEEESKTADTLRIFADPGVVYAGKLLFSLALSAFLLVILVPLYIVLMDLDLPSVSRFLLVVALGSFGIASATTIIAAIVSKASVKGALFAVLSFPLLLPVLLSAMTATDIALQGGNPADMWNYIKILIAYPIIVITLSYILFEYVWSE